ncbi:MAG TPA: SDR family oxidoreductase [Pseudomonadales bacterium]|nr:SDR family oxidoreductase [Pseudomonadales bacterium]
MSWNNSVQKAIFITGAASGIGKATAMLFAKKGWFVGLADRDEMGVRRLHQQLGTRITSFHRVDVTDFASVKEALEAFSSQTGGQLHVLLNNAGVLKVGCFEDIPLAAHHQIIDVNVKGVINCTYAAFELLKNTKGARVINMSSASAEYGSPDFASYSASKFAVRALTEALNVEWARHDITVTDVMPPFVDTPMLDGSARKSRVTSRLGVNLSAEDIANAVWESTHSNRLHRRVSMPFKIVATGQKYAPEWLRQQLAKLISGY